MVVHDLRNPAESILQALKLTQEITDKEYDKILQAMSKQFNKMFEEYQSKYNSNLKKFESRRNLPIQISSSHKDWNN